MTDTTITSALTGLPTVDSVPFSDLTAEADNEDPFSLNFEELLILQLEELQNQDPLEPQDTGEMTQELAAMSSVSEQSETNDQLSAIHDDQNALLDELIVAQSTQNGSLEELASLETQSQETLQAITDTQSYLLELQSVSNLNLEQSLAMDMVGNESLVLSDTASLTEGTLETVYSITNNTNTTTITITSEDGTVLKTTNGETSSGLHTYEWDGIADDGTVYTEGTFNISIVTETSSVYNEVDGIIENISSATLHELDDGVLEFRYTLDEQTSSATAEIYNEDGELINTIDVTSTSGINTAIWDGTDADGVVVDQDAKYQVVVTTSDDTGSIIRPNVEVVSYSNNVVLAGEPITVDYNLDDDVNLTRITVYDSKGEAVKIVEGSTSEGAHQFTWDGSTDNGETLTDGSYNISIETFAGSIETANAETYEYQLITGVQSIGAGNTYLETDSGQLVLLDTAISIRTA